MRTLRITFTSKFESEYFESRLQKNSIAYTSYDMSPTDTIISATCQEIRMDGFDSGLLYFTFLRNRIEPDSIPATAKYVDKFQIYAIWG